jgi:hypothetical protein
MANGSVADDGFAFDDFSDDGDFVVCEHHTDTLADSGGIAADRNEMPIAGGANRDIASETEDAFCA